MRLDCVYARFYKSFNFDSVRKSHPEAKPDPWDLVDGDFFPYIAVPIDPRITAVVGANESGKSHLLSAIKKAIMAEGIEQRDLCRYSPFFSVERGKTSSPHLGLKWSAVDPSEAAALRVAAPDAPAEITDRTPDLENVQALARFIGNENAEIRSHLWMAVGFLSGLWLRESRFSLRVMKATGIVLESLLRF